MAKKAEVAVRMGGSQVERAMQVVEGQMSPLPPALAETIDLRGWLKSLLTGADYSEPDPGYLSREMSLNVLLGEGTGLTSEPDELPHLQDIVDDFPGATTGPIRITDLYIVPSSLDEGSKTYMILTWVSLEDNIVTRCSGGSMPVQTRIAKQLMVGNWPIDCQIVRDKTKDKGGRFLLTVWAVD